MHLNWDTGSGKPSDNARKMASMLLAPKIISFTIDLGGPVGRCFARYGMNQVNWLTEFAHQVHAQQSALRKITISCSAIDKMSQANQCFIYSALFKDYLQSIELSKEHFKSLEIDFQYDGPAIETLELFEEWRARESFKLGINGWARY